VSTAARSRSLQYGRNAQLTAGLQERGGILTPTLLVEINGKEKARLALQHRVNARDKRLPIVIHPG
jgi:hypothetical protein